MKKKTTPKHKKKINNYAFIDGQNLNLGTKSENWSVDFGKFRIYLKDKYQVSKVYYFLWYMQEENEWLYTNLQEAGFIVVFKKQMKELQTHKKWNIDSDLIFHIMKKLIDKPDDFNQIILVSGDWDFKILVDFLIKKDRLRKVLFPNKKYASSLYNGMTNYFFDYMNNIKSKIEYKKKSKKESKKLPKKEVKKNSNQNYKKQLVVKTTKKITKKIVKKTTKKRQ